MRLDRNKQIKRSSLFVLASFVVGVAYCLGTFLKVVHSVKDSLDE